MSTRGALFDPVFGATGVAQQLSDQAWITALLDVEAALSCATAAVGVADGDHCAAVAAAAAELSRPGAIDVDALGRAAAAGGNPVIPLVKILRARVARDGVPAAVVHPGATSQDVMDCALMLLVRRAGTLVLADLTRAADSAAHLAAVHRSTPMVARTLGQQALPTTFGLLASSWFTALDAAAVRLDIALSTLPVQFGGAAGTLAASYPDGMKVSDALADELGLERRAVPWHTDRVTIAELATTFGIVAGAVSKPATDIVAMASTELSEVSELVPGGSSTMPHKRNPVAAVTARAAARRAPALVATTLSAMDHEFARAAGAWHAEWETVTDLVRSAGGAAHQLSASLTGLQVHPEAMARNLDLTGGAILAERVTAKLSAHTDQAREIVTAAATSGISLDQDPTIARYLSPAELTELLDPAHYLGHATDLVARALAERPTGESR
ncbi:3-carboxy-cis,cis-muconate cycloisomerase [Rhodococcus sp. 27YEA15]|uniref:3-carboxy-cis,cis-muconate cycloisomerase n=1 Tax=Rhodococcus sp. 27YEA15 TaxID=3156259 RepID=UPI003C7B69FB